MKNPTNQQQEPANPLAELMPDIGDATSDQRHHAVSLAIENQRLKAAAMTAALDRDLAILSEHKLLKEGVEGAQALLDKLMQRFDFSLEQQCNGDSIFENLCRAAVDQRDWRATSPRTFIDVISLSQGQAVRKRVLVTLTQMTVDKAKADLDSFVETNRAVLTMWKALES